MTLRLLPARPRHETRELDLARGLRDARRVLAVKALVGAGMPSATAKVCIARLESGSADAFAAAYSMVVSLGVTANVFKSWCCTHGYAGLFGELHS